MMTPKTVIQLIQVFDQFRINYLSGVPLHKSYQDAVRKIADKYSVTYQTIGDGCRRRLKFADISQLYQLLEDWMNGDPGGLLSQLKQNSDPVTHSDIDLFFSNSGPDSEITSSASVASISEQRANVFSFHLSEADARLLRALSEIEGSSSSQLVTKIVQEAVQKKMKEFAEKMVDTDAA